MAERLTLLALKNTYHQNIIAQGPEVTKVVQNGENITIDFKNWEKLQTRNNEQLTGFEVMNEKGEIISPKAEIKNNQVILHLDKNEKIIKVLYAYKPFTRANLENETGLPASTFSIDLK
ncbi:MAG TPA: hypothetical protein VIJ95_16645 [Hanamia sp.]